MCAVVLLFLLFSSTVLTKPTTTDHLSPEALALFLQTNKEIGRIITQNWDNVKLALPEAIAIKNSLRAKADPAVVKELDELYDEQRKALFEVED